VPVLVAALRASARRRHGVLAVSPTPGKNKKKTLFSAMPPWRRHSKPATPPLFGGVFSKNRHAFPSWRRRGRFLTTLFG